MPISAADAPSNLPKHAKEIYVSAFNNSYATTCKKRSDRDECAAKIAWSAVKKKYKKVGDKWTAKALSLGEKIRRVREAFHATLPPVPPNEIQDVWVSKVYDEPDDHIIVETKDGFYSYPYTIKDGKVAFGDPTKVEIEYVPVKAVRLAKGNDDSLWAVKSLGEDRIGQYAVRWGDENNPDLINEFFTPETDFWLGTWPRMPVLYHHGYNPKLTGRRSVVGQWDTFKPDDIGLWVEGELEKAHAYREAIDQLIGEKSLWLSSAALPRDGCIVVADNGHIKSWPIVEVSLTPTPMEPRMADVAFLKANFEFGIDLDTVERKELMMSDKGKKNLWQAVGEAFGRALGRLDEPAAEELQEDTPDADTGLDAEGAKALAETLGTQISETVTRALADTTAELKGEIEAFKAQLAEFDGRLTNTEKTAETKVAEIVERLPPVVAAPASSSVATVAGKTKAPKTESDFMKLVADLVKTGLANQILTPSAEVE